MSFPADLEGLCSARRRSPRRQGQDHRFRRSGWIELLESRRLLSTLNLAGTTVAPSPGPLRFDVGIGSSHLTVSISGSTYTFTDPIQTIFLTGTAVQAG